jgi:hypothetical protein
MPVIHRCGSCPRLWTGYAEAHCSACHRHFGSVKAFDSHRGGDACHNPNRLRDQQGNHKLVEQHRSSGLVWVFPGPEQCLDESESDPGMGGTPGD